jgi:hypothetical protein
MLTTNLLMKTVLLEAFPSFSFPPDASIIRNNDVTALLTDDEAFSRQKQEMRVNNSNKPLFVVLKE